MDLPITLRAMILASEEHFGSKKTPFNHLQQVATLAFEEAGDNLSDEEKDTLVATSFLHHILEDSDLTLAEINMEFGEEVAQIVGALTRRKNEGQKTYLRRISDEGGRIAILIKRADRLDNVQSLSSSSVPSGFAKRYIFNTRKGFLPVWRTLDPEGAAQIEQALERLGE